jgi:energy-coupling factor transporter ATP-binding protein EcfA2
MCPTTISPLMIWIEHDTQLMRDLADKVLVLHYGKELALGPPNRVLSDPAVIAAYIGKRWPAVTWILPRLGSEPLVGCTRVRRAAARRIISRITRPSRGSRSSGRTS